MFVRRQSKGLTYRHTQGQTYNSACGHMEMNGRDTHDTETYTEALKQTHESGKPTLYIPEANSGALGPCQQVRAAGDEALLLNMSKRALRLRPQRPTENLQLRLHSV